MATIYTRVGSRWADNEDNVYIHASEVVDTDNDDIDHICTSEVDTNNDQLLDQGIGPTDPGFGSDILPGSPAESLAQGAVYASRLGALRQSSEPPLAPKTNNKQDI